MLLFSIIIDRRENHVSEIIDTFPKFHQAYPFHPGRCTATDVHTQYVRMTQLYRNPMAVHLFRKERPEKLTALRDVAGKWSAALGTCN